MELDVAQLRRSHWIIGGGAVALFISTFLFKWFGASVSSSLPGGSSISVSASVNAWHSLTNTRWLLLLTILAALLFVVAVAAQRELSLPVAPSGLLGGLAGITAILVFYRILDHPHGSASSSVVSVSYGAKLGLYLGFIACLVIVYGAYEAMREEGLLPSAPTPPGAPMRSSGEPHQTP